jgi:hypothetical protein
MQTILIDLQYLPNVAYFDKVFRADTVILERHENFVKQSYRNRCYINTANGVGTLIVPLAKGHGKILITDVQIDYSQKWLNNHWRSIQSAYGKAPFFEYYSDELHDCLFKKVSHLYDLNYQLLTMCLYWLKHSVTIKESLAYEKETLPSVVDLRSVLHPKKEDNLNALGEWPPYTQVFGKKFVSELSIIDLIFCLGPDARNYIQQMSRPVNK